MSNKFDAKGVTLVELLAAIVIVSILAVLCYQVLFQGFSNYQRIKIENELRDEADIIMASLVKEVFVLNKSDIQNNFSCPDYYLSVSKPNNSATEIGIKNRKVMINGKEIKFYDKDVKLVSEDCNAPDTSEKPFSYISNDLDNDEYLIHIVLERNGKYMAFDNIIKVISKRENVE